MAPDEVLRVMAVSVEVLRVRLPEQDQETIERAVYDVATELVSTITDPDRLATMLRLRATARLSAATGDPVPIRSAEPPLPEPRGVTPTNTPR